MPLYICVIHSYGQERASHHHVSSHPMATCRWPENLEFTKWENFRTGSF